jgi:hypothetical protein
MFLKSKFGFYGHFALVTVLTLISLKSFSADRNISESSEFNVRISAVNGTALRIDDTTLKELDVQPGEILRLSADLFTDEGVAQKDSADDFVWSASLEDSCNLLLAKQKRSDCSKTSNFQVTPDGVAYRVPADMPYSLSLSVYSHSQGEAEFDFIVLRYKGASQLDPQRIPTPTTGSRP